MIAALSSILYCLLGVGAAFVWGFPNWREAVDYARRGLWVGVLLHGALAVAVLGVAALSFFNLSAMLLIGALVVERGVMP